MSDARAAFLTRSERGGMVPLMRQVVLDADTPLAAFAKVARSPFAFLLESLVGGERWARYTFLGTEPREVWRYRGRAIDRWTRETGWRGAGETDDPIGHLAQRMRALPAVPVPGLPRFTGGAVGYLGYDLVRTIERLPRPPADTLDLPDAIMMIADTLVIVDNLFGRAIVVANVEVPARAAAAERLRLYDAAEARLAELIVRLRGRHELVPLALRDTLPAVPTTSRYPRAAFERDVSRILEYIRAGDTFQTVLSRRQDAAGAVDPFLLYRYLRALNPAPYLFYLALDDFALVGSSPEVLVRVMAIIDELEPERRGPYAGAVGYVGWGATNLDTAIAIRAAVVLKDRVVVQAGAGIVADSDPAREFAETEAKAQAVLKALALARSAMGGGGGGSAA